MTEEQKLELFIKYGLTDKEKEFLSEPMNTIHEKQFAAFKRGYAMGVAREVVA